MPPAKLDGTSWLAFPPAGEAEVLIHWTEEAACDSRSLSGEPYECRHLARPAAWPRHIPIAASSLIFLVILGVAWSRANCLRGARGSVGGAMPDGRAWLHEVSRLQEEEREWRCGIQEDGVDYWTRQGAFWTFTDVVSVDDCIDKCFLEGGCMAWTFGKPGAELEGKCFLKQLEQGEIPMSNSAPGVVSGSLPCNMVQRRPPGTLFCYALVRPGSYEQQMVAMQHREKASIFNCERAELYSNQVLWIAPGLITRYVDTSLKCDFGGEFGTALNNEIFLAVWAKVIADKFYLDHDWTVKADPDAVFFPGRLRRKLPHYQEAAAHPQGVVMNNCKFGMHGPMEVLSRNAVTTWGGGTKQCKKHFAKHCGGDCKWGEDMFIDQCLWKVLGAKRFDDWDLLTEDHCVWDPSRADDWMKCEVWSVAFHPYKTEESYLECMQKAVNSKDPTVP